MVDRELLLAEKLGQELENHRESAIRIQDMFERLMPVGSDATVIDREYPLETEILQHFSHKRKAEVLVREKRSGRVFETDITRMVVPGLYHKNRSLHPAEKKAPPVQCDITEGVAVPADSPISRETIEYNRKRAIEREGETRRPPTAGRPPKYPFWALLPGDTFFTEQVSIEKLRAAVNQRRIHHGQHYAVRAEPPGVRVYRLK